MGDSLAWVTLATNDSYSLGALVLAHSLKQVGTKQQLAVLITPGVTGAMRSKLQEVFNLVQEVNLLDSRDETNLRLLKRPELGITFTKLHCWRLTQFNKCVFLDADTLVLENCDELFEREELSAAPDIGWPDCFNSGVFVFRPSNETYEKLIQLALEKGSFDGGDQGLLNLYFSDWAYKDISKHLPFIYNMASTACYSYLPAFKQFGRNAKIIHFIGTAKPWLQYFDTETKQVHPAQDIQHLKEILQRWWDIFCACIHPNLSSEMSVRSHTDTVHGSQPHIPNNPHPNPLDHYYNSQFFPNPSAPNPAVNYQNVWDPWEEYDSKQLQQKSAECVDTYHFHEHVEKPFDQYSYETPKTDNYLNRSEQIEQHKPPQNCHQNTEISSNDNWNSPSHNSNVPNYDHNNFGHIPNNPSHYLDPPSSNPTQDVHSNYQERDQEIELFHTETNTETVKSHIQNWQNQLLESHNTTAYSDADKSNANVPPHTPINSQPQPVVHNDSPKDPLHEISQLSTQSPTIPGFRLPDESITTTVSDEITLQTDSIEDSKDNAGIAGAFAKLTLGTPRTAEQLALDDHLRRQGWEVGNIDYLGRDSFENIWSKICETLSSGPEPPQSTAKVKSEPVIQKEASVLDSTAPQQIESAKPEVQPTESKIIPAEIVGKSIETSTAETELEALKPKTDDLKPKTANLESTKPSEVPQSVKVPQSDVVLPEPAAKSCSVPLAESSKTTPETQKSVSESPKLLDPAKETSQVVSPTAETPKTEADTVTPQPQAKTDLSQLPPAETPKSVTEVAPVAENVPASSEVPKSTPESIPPSSESIPKVTESPKPTAETPEPLKISPEPEVTAPQPKVESPKPAPEGQIPAPETPKAATGSPKQVADNAKPETETPKPLETSKPASETPKTVAESPKVEAPPPVSSESVAATPKVEALPPVSSKGAVESPKVVAPPPVSSKGAVESPKVEPTPPVSSKSAAESTKVETSQSVSSKSVPESPKVETPQPPSNVTESPKPETKPLPPQTVKSTPASEQKGKKSKEVPKADVTQPIPPTTTTPGSSQSKQTKQALSVEASVPDTPPPTDSSAGPTPPPRKGGSDKKKAGTKAKK